LEIEVKKKPNMRKRMMTNHARSVSRGSPWRKMQKPSLASYASKAMGGTMPGLYRTVPNVWN
jgi:hypothetical protein